jgi:hypothetical protein
VVLPPGVENFLVPEEGPTKVRAMMMMMMMMMMMSLMRMMIVMGGGAAAWGREFPGARGGPH